MGDIPSHPDFDRSKLSDGQYIELLLFEIKELNSTLARKDLLIQSLQGNLNLEKESADATKEDSKKEPLSKKPSKEKIPNRTKSDSISKSEPIAKSESTAKPEPISKDGSPIKPEPISKDQTPDEIGIPIRSARRKPTDQEKSAESNKTISEKLDPIDLEPSYEGLKISRSNEPLRIDDYYSSDPKKEEAKIDTAQKYETDYNSPLSKESARDLSQEISRDISNENSQDLSKEGYKDKKLTKEPSIGSLRQDTSIGDLSTSTAIESQIEARNRSHSLSRGGQPDRLQTESAKQKTPKAQISSPRSERSSVYSTEESERDYPEVNEAPEDKIDQPQDSTISEMEESAIDSTLSNRSSQIEEKSTNSLRPFKSSDTQNSTNRSINQTMNQSANMSANQSGIFQHKNHSASSFQSYKSRIKLPTNMQNNTLQLTISPQIPSQPQLNNQHLEPRNQPTDLPLSPQRSHPNTSTFTSPQQPSNEPPRIPLPQSPDDGRNNILSANGNGMPHSKTLRDLNVQNLKIDAPPPTYKYANESNSLRSPASINPNSGSQIQTPQENSISKMGSPRKQDTKEAPHTPNAFYNDPDNGSIPMLGSQFGELVSNLSSPAVPPSQYSQTSPATGYSNGGFGYDNDSLRTPGTTNDYLSQDSVFNYRGGMNSNKNLKSGSSFLVNRNVSNDSGPEEDALFIKPEDFQTITINVASTISTGNSQGQSSTTSTKRLEDVQITLTINDRDSGKEMWRIKKSLNQLVAFDNEIRPTVEYFGLPILPDKSLFFSSTPNKIDIRRSGLQNYFNTLFVMPHIPHLILFRICKYLSLDFVNPLDEFKSGAKKEGYLVRKYKGLGTNWKIRWCQVDGPQLELYDLPGGTLLEQINLVNCQIGRQSSDTVAEDKGYRHAFLIMESHKTSKLSSSIPKHFFCAETDHERDEWVSMLIESNEGSAPPLDVDDNSSSSNITANASEGTLLNTPRSQPDYQDDLESSTNKIFKSPLHTSHTTTDTERSHEGKEKDREREREKRNKKRSIFPFRKNASSSNNSQNPMFDHNNIIDSDLNNSITPPPHSNSYGYNNQPYQLSHNSHSQSQLQNPNTTISSQSTTGHDESSIQLYLDKMGLDDNMSKQIFGRDVLQAYEISHHTFLERPIPSICYRCIDFLIRTGAIYEEGIFRLSGSASTIRQLKELFNKKFDLDLFENELKPDIHTVAGLFKTYLRELPSPILTDNAYNDLRQMIINNGANSATALKFKEYLSNGNNIPKINYDLCYIIFKFLKEIVNNNHINKMNLRNVSIVFVPTLNISLDVLGLLLVDFNCIFENQAPTPDNQRENLELNIPSF